MNSLLKERLQKDMVAALRAQEKRRLSVLRLMLAAVKQAEVDQRVELSDADIYSILHTMIKQRRDAMAQYLQAQHDDLAEQERFEQALIQTYLPEPLTPEEMDCLLSQVIEQTAATSLKDMGKVMAELKLKCQNRVDIGAISAQVRERLSSL